MQQLDAQRFAVHFSEFVSLADAGAGLQAYVEALEAKHRLFAGALAEQYRLLWMCCEFVKFLLRLNCV